MTSSSPSQHARFFGSFQASDRDATQSVLDQVKWTDEASTMLESIIGSTVMTICVNSSDSVHLSLMHFMITYLDLLSSPVLLW